MHETRLPSLSDSELHHRQPQEASLDGAVRSLLAPIWDMLAKIEARLGTSPASPPLDAGEIARSETAPADGPRGDRNPDLAQFAAKIEGLERSVGDLCQHLLPFGMAATPTPIPAAQSLFPDILGNQGVWEEIVLGADLSQDPSWDTLRRDFLGAVAAGDRAARFLAGQLMLAQNAAAEKLPELLKQVGEAYYNWRPRRASAEDPMEQALTRWLNRLAEQAGLPNSIQLVRPGDRFDNSRHIANGRGVEVVEVQGWVVLRDGNRVYTKANVSVK